METQSKNIQENQKDIVRKNQTLSEYGNVLENTQNTNPFISTHTTNNINNSPIQTNTKPTNPFLSATSKSINPFLSKDSKSINPFLSEGATSINPFTTQQVQMKANNTGLPNNIKSGIENLSGYSLDDVKVHYNSDKPAKIQAHAYAQGADIHIGSGQEKHLPHEAWHVVQQKQGRVKPTLQLKNKLTINNDEGLEQEADLMGAKALEIKSSVTLNQNILTSSQNTAQLQENSDKKEEEMEMIEKEGGAIQTKLKNVSVNQEVAQLAYTAKRPLMGWLHFGMGDALFENKGVFHEHIFFEDDGNPPDIGFQDGGLFQEKPEMYDKYEDDDKTYDDAIMREAVKQVGDPGEYKLFGNNCQNYVKAVLEKYKEIQDKNAEEKKPNANFFDNLFNSRNSDGDDLDDEIPESSKKEEGKSNTNFFDNLFNSRNSDGDDLDDEIPESSKKEEGKSNTNFFDNLFK